MFNYSLTDADAYGAYPPAAMASMAGHEFDLLVADYASEPKEGSPGEVTVVLRFPSKDAAMRWYDSDAYREVRHLRTDNSTGHVVLCDEFVMPS